ncbi:MAG: AzlD domain-containing protein [Clostridia bacterium]|jgi:branched-subunit amino acid transport protein AzlD|nr:AzlD domain-containing protein [Clostridia bacterium]QTE72439.1 AzlD domain-containing protein [Clostridiales bacterium FE2011]QTE73426.1 AzlD domain-containing protein [Clostridiales bacterium FE2010]
MNNTIYPLAVIGVIAVVTWALRAFPFLLFGNRPLPKVIRYLGKALPPAIMTVLVIYCLRDISFSQSPFGIPELAACALVVILQAVRKNMYLSIIAGTVCYMVLIRVM